MVNFTDHPLTSRTTQIQSPPSIQQVPTKVNDIHAGSRISISVILSLRKTKVPKAILLRGELDGGETFNLTVPIMAIQLRDAEPGLPWVHTLVAWRLIQEHKENKAPLPRAATLASDDDIRKAVIVRLGEKYQLASQYTSFVAVDAGQDDARRPRAMVDTPLHPGSPSPLDERTDAPSTTNTIHNGLRSRLQNILASMLGFGLYNQNSSQGVPGAWQGSSPPSYSGSEVGDDNEGYESARTFSTLSSLEGSDSWSDWSPPASPHLGPQIDSDDEPLRSPSPQFVPEQLAPEEERLLLPRKPLPMLPPPPPPMVPEVVNLIRLQAFDGSFSLHELRNFVGSKAVDEANNLNVDNKVWATALSVAFIRKRMGGQKELLNDLIVKAMEFLGGTNLNVEDIVRQAEVSLA